jgi:hypothetical protein
MLVVLFLVVYSEPKLKVEKKKDPKTTAINFFKIIVNIN